MAETPEKSNVSLEASPEQLIYAAILEKGMYIGLLILLITYFIYILGFLAPLIPLDKISDYWTMNVDQYLHEAGIHAGWAWLRLLRYGDYLNFIGVAILAGVTIICYLRIVPTLFRNNDKAYAIMALLEAVILSVAASGLLGSGGH